MLACVKGVRLEWADKTQIKLATFISASLIAHELGQSIDTVSNFVLNCSDIAKFLLLLAQLSMLINICLCCELLQFDYNVAKWLFSPVYIHETHVLIY